MNRPTFFISSTIYDFRDLRSAIKFHLEAQGCVVLASEFNDFQKPLDLHTYQACLRSIEQADYYILLIGNRVGGWYDEREKISITQMEYRKAYELHKEGKLNIISFVRSEVWQHREEISSLANYLEQENLNAEAITRVVNHPSRFASDAEFVCKFIEEVTKNQETIRASQGLVPFPTGNWLHQFSSFRDVADVLRTVLFSGLPTHEAAFRAALQHELFQMLRNLLIRNNSGVLDPSASIERYFINNPISMASRNFSEIRVPAKEWDRLATLLLHINGMKINSIVLNEAVLVPFFLKFNSRTSAYEETPEFKAIHQLVEEIRQFNRVNTSDAFGPFFKNTPRARNGSMEPIRFSLSEISILIYLSLRWVNIIRLAWALWSHFDGKAFVSPKLMPYSPIQHFDSRIADETLTDDQLQSFLRRE